MNGCSNDDGLRSSVSRNKYAIRKTKKNKKKHLLSPNEAHDIVLGVVWFVMNLFFGQKKNGKFIQTNPSKTLIKSFSPTVVVSKAKRSAASEASLLHKLVLDDRWLRSRTRRSGWGTTPVRRRPWRRRWSTWWRPNHDTQVWPDGSCKAQGRREVVRSPSAPQSLPTTMYYHTTANICFPRLTIVFMSALTYGEQCRLRKRLQPLGLGRGPGLTTRRTPGCVFVNIWY